MIYYVSANASRCGRGTKEAPFRTISQAAAAALPGDEILVASASTGSPSARCAEGPTTPTGSPTGAKSPLGAVITGAEPVKNWTLYEGNVWMARIPNGIFGSYNPYTTVIRGDWYHSVTPAHTGEVYLNGKSLYEAGSLTEVLHPSIYQSSWDPDFTTHRWYTEQDGDVTVIYANFQGACPNEENVEINVRRNCFYPDQTGIGYITLSGFTVRQAATTWAPPTAYQEGMVGPHWSRGWIIEDCDISHSKCSGISLENICSRRMKTNGRHACTRTVPRQSGTPSARPSGRGGRRKTSAPTSCAAAISTTADRPASSGIWEAFSP